MTEEEISAQKQFVIDYMREELSHYIGEPWTSEQQYDINQKIVACFMDLRSQGFIDSNTDVVVMSNYSDPNVFHFEFRRKGN